KIYFIHLLLGAAFGVLTAYLTKSYVFGVLFFLAIAILWFYSYRLKKALFLGNMVVAIMAAAPVYSVLMVMFFSDWNTGNSLLNWISDNQQIVGFVFGYSFFAVTTHFLREIVKDIQDMDGDKAFRCLTVPIKYGKMRAAIIAQWITVVVIAFLGMAQLILFVNDYLLMGFYSFLIIVFLIMIFIRIRKAESAADFGKAGSLIKWMMLLGILSMVLIPFS
ncbi:MAG TPA: UbiA family prenyltransferase, partial [Bacteroidales bacterium]|nr:UbiA family prenyltransferase [Bacteroidales bacterium]